MNRIIDRLKIEVVPAMGCTEPVAIALAAAFAGKGIAEKDAVKRVSAKISCNVYKNAKAVGIPGSVASGVEVAIALGLSVAKPQYDLTIFSGVDEDVQKRAAEFLERTTVEIEIVYGGKSVYIDVTAEDESAEVMGRAVIEERHANLTYLQQGKEVLLDQRNYKQEGNISEAVRGESLTDLLRECLHMPIDDLYFLREGIAMNMAVAQAGLDLKDGLGIGQGWRRLMEKSLVTADLSGRISLYTAAACDARMSGAKLPVMSSSGSGNNGITVIIPVAVTAEYLGADEAQTVRALALSHLVNSHIKEHIGRLSPVCGCGVSAGAGAAAGIAYLLGGNIVQIEDAISGVVSSLAGMICDGGKVGCALKLTAGANMALQCALLALEGVRVPAGNGIVGEDLNATLQNLGEVCRRGMAEVDKSILGAMLRKDTRFA